MDIGTGALSCNIYRGGSVVDYVLAQTNLFTHISNFVVGVRVRSLILSCQNRYIREPTAKSSNSSLDRYKHFFANMDAISNYVSQNIVHSLRNALFNPCK